MLFPRVDKLTNALVEIGLLLASVGLGAFNQPIWTIAVMIVMSSLWWGVVHRTRLGALIKAAPINALGTFALALILMAFGHGVGFALGYAGHQILGKT